MFSKFEDIPIALERELRPNTTHILVFSLFRHAYKRISFVSKEKSSKANKQYSVTFPDLDYRAESSVQVIKAMLMQVKNVCPSAQLYIMIPVFPDLPYYNIYRNIKFAPTEVKDWYYSLPRSSAKQLNQDTYHVYNELMRLHTSEVRWSLKRTVALSEVLFLMSKSTNRNYESLLIPDNDIYSLGPNGPMVDGIHPSKEFIDALWRLLHNYDVFGERSPRESFTTVTTNLNETTRHKMIPHERISGDYRQNKHDLRSKLSQSSHSSPSPLLGVTESLPSTSSGSTSNIHNDKFSAYSPYFSKKRPASTSHTISSKRLQTSVPIPYPVQRMTLEQIGLIQGRFNIFASYMMGITHLNTPTISEDDMKAMVLYFLKDFSPT
ncbi:UNVERIFIED_CONTAM: hypothetical protein RMT77_017586 [Armadillidium vulgare]